MPRRSSHPCFSPAARALSCPRASRGCGQGGALWRPPLTLVVGRPHLLSAPMCRVVRTSLLCHGAWPLRYAVSHPRHAFGGRQVPSVGMGSLHGRAHWLARGEPVCRGRRGRALFGSTARVLGRRAPRVGCRSGISGAAALTLQPLSQRPRRAGAPLSVDALSAACGWARRYRHTARGRVGRPDFEGVCAAAPLPLTAMVVRCPTRCCPTDALRLAWGSRRHGVPWGRPAVPLPVCLLLPWRWRRTIYGSDWTDVWWLGETQRRLGGGATAPLCRRPPQCGPRS